MKRREFITLLGAAAMASWPLVGRAQQRTDVFRIGYLGVGPAATSANRVAALRRGLRDLGYVEGKNILIEFRWAENGEQLRELAAELVGLNVDVVFATSSTEVDAARQVTKTIPIVFATHADPVAVGHVASLARPGGNITGLSVLQTELTAKGLEILKEAVPSATRFGVLWNSAAPSRVALPAAEVASAKLGVRVHMAPVRTAEDFQEAFASMAREGADGVFVMASSFTRSNAAILAELALKHQLPSMFGARENVEAGGLMSYAPDLRDLTRRAAVYIDKVLRGAKPADLPVEQATRFEFVINLKTAKGLGLTIPPTLLSRADEVIE
jgi:putative ABC transport system substrate-binding protein